MTNNAGNIIRINNKGPIEIREILKADFSTYNIYKLKGQVLPCVYLDGYLADQLRAFSMIEKDLRSVISWAKKIQYIIKEYKTEESFINPDTDKSIVIKGLFIAILTTYGKCFSQANGRSFTLNKKHIPTKFNALHEYVIDKRNNFAAHKGEYVHEVCNVSLVLYKKSKESRVEIFTELKQINFGLDVDNEDELSFFKCLCEELRQLISDKRSQVINKIIEEKILLKPPKYWIKLSGQKVVI